MMLKRHRHLVLVLCLSILTACALSPSGSGDRDLLSPDGRKVDLAWGKTVYQQNCARCHDTGANGAQIIGDTEGWRSRLSRGLPTVVAHAIEGYHGALGFMPPRGGNPNLSHEDVTAATVYIVQSSIYQD